jgi:alanine dehydrogenase
MQILRKLQKERTEAEVENAITIGAAEVGRILTPAIALESAAAALRAIHRRTAEAPARLIHHLPEGFFAVMPGTLEQPAVFGAKLVSLLPGNADKALSVVQGVVVLFDATSGAPVAFVDGGSVTALRTAAASAVATQLLAVEDADTLALFGCGTQAAAHVDAIRGVRPIREVLVWGRSPDRAEAFAQSQAARTGLKFRVVDGRTAAAAPVICTVTAAREPILSGEWLSAGAHVNLVGAHSATTREIDSAGIAAGRVYVDSLSGALVEAGDLLIPIAEARIAQDHIVGELGALLDGAVEGRRSSNEITIFKSLGHVAQDLSAAHMLQTTLRSE